MANDLFADAAGGRLGAQAPLPQRVRPQALDEFAGQRDVIGEGSALQRAIAEDRVGSMIFYGPPGTGKTTLARIVAHTTRAHFEELSGVRSGSPTCGACFRSRSSDWARPGRRRSC